MKFQKNLKVESSIFLRTKQQIVTTQMKYLLYNYKVIPKPEMDVQYVDI
jgi:hypothetical protein